MFIDLCKFSAAVNLIFLFLPPLQYGRAALESVMKSVLRYETPLVSPPTEYSGDFFEGKFIFYAILVINNNVIT